MKIEYLVIETKEDFSTNENWLNNYGEQGLIYIKTVENVKFVYDGMSYDYDKVIIGYTHVFYKIIS